MYKQYTVQLVDGLYWPSPMGQCSSNVRTGALVAATCYTAYLFKSTIIIIHYTVLQSVVLELSYLQGSFYMKLHHSR